MGAQCVGPFRTEFFFLERDMEPGAEQQAAFQGVFDAFPGRKLVLRTLGGGADIRLPFLTAIRSRPRPSMSAAPAQTSPTRAYWGCRAGAVSSADVWVHSHNDSTADEAAGFARVQCRRATIARLMAEVPSPRQLRPRCLVTALCFQRPTIPTSTLWPPTGGSVPGSVLSHLRNSAKRNIRSKKARFTQQSKL
ncbi:putative PEP-binding protein [Arthrobacter crystallopoietes]|uniref:putative PEP-binding protein n=1 Tax=Crystallibacter crystallopoietes TaxID=37928 RepID=UPI001F108564|nr:putative PEP-binding protein [Arthrobacter crystallopoietes]